MTVHSDATYLLAATNESVLDAIVDASFSLSYKVDPITTRVGIRNEPGEDRGLAHLVLLWALPPVWVSKDKRDLVFDSVPEGLAVGDAFGDVLAGAFEHVAQEVGENLNHGFAMGKRGKVLLDDVRSTDGIRAEMELESEKGGVRINE